MCVSGRDVEQEVRKRTIGLDGFPKSRRRKTEQPVSATASQPSEAEAAPFSKVKPSRKKIGPRQQAKAASAQCEQENSSAKANSIPLAAAPSAAAAQSGKPPRADASDQQACPTSSSGAPDAAAHSASEPKPEPVAASDLALLPEIPSPGSGRRKYGDLIAGYVEPIKARYIGVNTSKDLGECSNLAAVTWGQRAAIGGLLHRWTSPWLQAVPE
ncbi:TPA: hypothetical protein ACH3X3_007325 [Trebouxia sp. C0006]